MVKKFNPLKTISLILAVIALIILIIFIVKNSFGFFQYKKKGENVNVVSINGLDININQASENALNLTNVYPVYDSDGLTTDPFTFTINNTSSKAIDYTLKIENDTAKQSSCYIDENETIPCTLLSTDYIKVAYSINDGAYTTPKILGSTNNNILFSETINGKDTMKVAIKLWIDSAAPNSIQGNVFFGKLIISGDKGSTETMSVNDTYVLNIPNGVANSLNNLQITGNTSSSTKVGQSGTINLVVSGKNMFKWLLPTNPVCGVSIVYNNDGTYTTSGTMAANCDPTFMTDYIYIPSQNIYPNHKYCAIAFIIPGNNSTAKLGKYKTYNDYYITGLGSWSVDSSNNNVFGANNTFITTDFKNIRYYIQYHRNSGNVQGTVVNEIWKPQIEICDNYSNISQYAYSDPTFEAYKEMRYTIQLKDTSGTTINGLGSGEVLKKVNGKWVIQNGNNSTELHSSTQTVLNGISIYNGVSNIWVDDDVSINGISATYQKTIN